MAVETTPTVSTQPTAAPVVTPQPAATTAAPVEVPKKEETTVAVGAGPAQATPQEGQAKKLYVMA